MARERIYVKKSMWTNGKLQDNTFKPFCKTTSIDPVMQILADRSQYCKPKSLSISEHERTEYIGKIMSILQGYPSPMTPDLTINVLDSRHQFIFNQKKKTQIGKKNETDSYRLFQNRKIRVYVDYGLLLLIQ